MPVVMIYSSLKDSMSDVKLKSHLKTNAAAELLICHMMHSSPVCLGLGTRYGRCSWIPTTAECVFR